MKNTTDLRDELIRAYDELKNRKIDIATAKAMIGFSNAMMKTVSQEAEYHKMTKSKNPIEFLVTPK